MAENAQAPLAIERRTILRGERTPHPPMALVAVLCTAVMFLLTVDAVVRERGEVDYRAIDAVQRIGFPGLEPVLRSVSLLTSSPWAIFAWVATLATFVAGRRWSAAIATLLIPVGVGINNLLISGVLVSLPRPDGAQLQRMIGETSATSFPSGHVAAAVLLYGLLIAVTGGLARPLLRNGIRLASLAVIVLVGPARIWLGSHWVSDVVAGYAFGGLLLMLMLALQRRLAPAVDGLPFAHAAPIPHDEATTHAHALTSTILFRGPTVAKVYAPGFVPRALYWLAFQAPFAYEANPLALRAALLRRNLAGLLTEHWYGTNRVSRALGVERIDGRLALIGEFVAGKEPTDHHAARRFLFDLADRFDAAGLPTWQIDPRQPRSLGNIMEGPDGTYAVIDLESGLVSPLASPRAWWRALRRGLVPIYDDVYFDLAHAYVEREADAMRAAHGDTWLAELRRTLDAAETAAAAWHESEPRVWSRLVHRGWSAFGMGDSPVRLPAGHAPENGAA